MNTAEWLETGGHERPLIDYLPGVDSLAPFAPECTWPNVRVEFLKTVGERRPWRCPVCEGRGLVVFGFYSPYEVSGTDASPETCRSCDGTGIIWG